MAASGAKTAGLRYDPLGRLYEVSGPAGTTRFLYDGDALIGEYDSAGNLLRRYVHGADSAADDPLAWYEGSAFSDAAERLLRSDWQGSIVVVANRPGSTVLAVNRYDEYGIPQSTNAGRFQYTGQAWLPELGMYHYKARMYSPTLGRFMQTDPIGYSDGINWYAYVANDPVNRSDPTGLYCDVGIGPDRNGCDDPDIVAEAPSQISSGLAWTQIQVTFGDAGRTPMRQQQSGPCPSGYDAADLAADASNASLALEGSAVVLGVGAIAASPTGVGGGVLGLGAAGAAAGSKIASVVSIGAYGYDYLKTGRTSSLVGAGKGALSLLASGIATRATSNIMRRGRTFGNLSAPQRAKMDAASSAYGSAAGAAENLI